MVAAGQARPQRIDCPLPAHHGCGAPGVGLGFPGKAGHQRPEQPIKKDRAGAMTTEKLLASISHIKISRPKKGDKQEKMPITITPT